MNRGPLILGLVGALALAAFAGYAIHDLNKSNYVAPAPAPATSFGGGTAAPGPPLTQSLPPKPVQQPTAQRAPAQNVAPAAPSQSLPSTPVEPPIAQPPVALPAVSETAKPASTPTEKVIVYVTRTGTKYHNAGCRYLAQSSIPMVLTEASARYGPCSVCNPPAPVSGQTAQATADTATTPDGKPAVAENGSRYGEISPATGKPKTTYVKGYTRKDGTYVRGYYRSK